MMLSRIPAVEGLTALQSRMNRLFDEVFPTGERSYETGWIPPLDAYETPEALVVKLEAPGVDPSTIDISVAGDHLEIRGAKPAEEVAKDGQWYHFERRTGAFHRRVALPFPVDADKIDATATHGLLVVQLPKKPEVLPKRISVKVK